MSRGYQRFASSQSWLSTARVWGVQSERREWLELTAVPIYPERPWIAESHSFCAFGWAFIRLQRTTPVGVEQRWLYLCRHELGRQQWHRLRRLLLLW